MDPDSFPIAVFLILLLFVASGFFAAAEFALLTLCRGRVEPSSRDGKRRAANVAVLVQKAEEFLIVTPRGRGLATLLLGYFAGLAGARLLGPGPLGVTGGVAVALGVMVVVHTVLGDQIPRLMGVQKASWL